MTSTQATTHTPGPWEVNHWRPDAVAGELISVTVRDGAYGYRRIADTYVPQTTQEEAFANARLIAAAPDLLASAARVDAWLLDKNDGGECPICGRPDYIECIEGEPCYELRAAIARARGEES